jgi:hypothetical protein
MLGPNEAKLLFRWVVHEAMDMHCDAIDSRGGGQSVPRISRGANGAALHARTG